MPQDVIRAEVADSWHRSAAAGVESDATEAPITLAEDTLRDYREAHPLAQVFPLLDDVLGQAARDCEAIMAVSDAAGQLLWVCGKPAAPAGGGGDRLRRGRELGRAAGRHQRARAWRSRLDRTATVIGAEHFRSSVKRWSCAATPIHDPASLVAARRPRRHRRRRPRRPADGGDGARRRPDGRGGAGPFAADQARADVRRVVLTPVDQPRVPRPQRVAAHHPDRDRRSAAAAAAQPAAQRDRCCCSPRRRAASPGDELAVLLYEDDGGELDAARRAEPAPPAARRRAARCPGPTA